MGFLTCTRRDNCQHSVLLTKIRSECEPTCVGGLSKRVVHLLSVDITSSSDYKRRFYFSCIGQNEIFLAKFGKRVQKIFWNNVLASTLSAHVIFTCSVNNTITKSSAGVICFNAPSFDLSKLFVFLVGLGCIVINVYTFPGIINYCHERVNKMNKIHTVPIYFQILGTNI